MSHSGKMESGARERKRTVSQQRTEEFRRAAVEKFYSRGSRSVEEVARVLGVSSWSLYHWSKGYGSLEAMKKHRRPAERSVQEKLKAVIEFEGLEGEKQGEYLRRKGCIANTLRDGRRAWRRGWNRERGVKRNEPQRMGGGQEKDQGVGERSAAQGSSVGGDHGAVGAEKKSGLDLGQRGERVSVADRRSCMEMVRQAKASGAGRRASCEVLEVSLRTLERWEKAPDKGISDEGRIRGVRMRSARRRNKPSSRYRVALSTAIYRPGRWWLS